MFFWLQNIALAKERVKIRVLEGGHNIEPDVIEMRYTKGIKNLFDIYLPVVDGVFIFDNSFGKHELIARKTLGGQFEIIKELKFAQLKIFMTELEKQKELLDKILSGLEKAYEKLIEFKKQKNSKLVIMQDGKIVKVKPQ